MAKNKFWNAEVRISKEMFENSYTMMCILRLIALFPLEIKRKAGGTFLKFSPWYALYSFILGGCTLSAMYYRIYEELNVEKKPSHTVKSTDKLVRFAAINAFCLIVFYGIFIMPSRLLRLFKYIKYSGQVDNIINTPFLRSNTYKSIFMLTMPLIYNLLVDVMDLYANYRVNKAPLLGILMRNSSYYTAYLMAFAVICLNRYMANCLEVRVVHMSNILKEEYFHLKNAERHFTHTSATSRATHISQVSNALEVHGRPTPFSNYAASITISNISRAYIKLINAAQMVSYLFGIINSVAIVAILCQTVASKYFIILALEGRGRDIFELLDWIGIFSAQIMRLLLIVEPWHSCRVELQNLKHTVCNLSSLNLDRRCREKITSFAMILCIRQYHFSACGLFIVDRLLYTTLIDTIVTFLVISLQAEEQDTV